MGGSLSGIMAKALDCVIDYVHFRTNTIGKSRGVVVIAVGNEHGDTSSNPGPD